MRYTFTDYLGTLFVAVVVLIVVLKIAAGIDCIGPYGEVMC